MPFGKNIPIKIHAHLMNLYPQCSLTIAYYNAIQTHTHTRTHAYWRSQSMYPYVKVSNALTIREASPRKCDMEQANHWHIFSVSSLPAESQLNIVCLCKCLDFSTTKCVMLLLTERQPQFQS